MHTANVMFVNQAAVFGDASVLSVQSEEEELSLEQEFELIMHSVLVSAKDDETHIVIRLRKMRTKDAENFYTLAAETVVACANTGLKKEEKYYHISVYFDKFRKAIDKGNPIHNEVFDKIDALVDKSIDIFDY